MKIETLQVNGFEPALEAMRNPMDSWALSDSDGKVGEKDKELSIRLQKSGPEHCKHLRMIMVWANITAPRYWWNEFDTYRTGVEKVSCSTMHKLMSRRLTPDDFQSCNDGCYSEVMLETIDYINKMIEAYKKEEDPKNKRVIWEYVIQCLPQSYLQKRTVMMSYAALRTMYRQREAHKLKEWHIFRLWIKSLPEEWMITE